MFVPSSLIVDLSKPAENKVFIERKNEERRSYQVEDLAKIFKDQKTSLVETLRKTLLLRGSCSEISVWKQKFSKTQVLWNEI